VTDDQRQQAIQRVRAKRRFWLHLGVYLVVTGLLVVVWALTWIGRFWPLWPTITWGAIVVVHALTVFVGGRAISEGRVERELKRQRGC
jgi:fatty acid desaturase